MQELDHPIVLKQGLSIAAVAALRALLPGIVAVLSLYACAMAFDVEFDRYFVTMSAIVAALALVILQPARPSGTQLVTGALPIALNIVSRWGVMLAILLGIGYATKYSAEFSRRTVLLWAVITPAALILLDLALYECMRRLIFHTTNVRRAVIAGCNDVSVALAERIARNTEMCLSVAGFFDDRSAERLGAQGPARLLGRLQDLAEYVEKNGVQVIFIALPVRHVRRVVEMLDRVRDTTASIYYVPDLSVYDLIQARTGEVLGVPVVAMCETPMYGYRGVAKRILDIGLASAILLVALPIMLMVAVAVKLSSHGSVLFKQRRLGLHGEEIVVYKFRTMNVTEDGADIAQATRGDPRVTRVGRFLRRYSLDELPQFINVLQGRMSLVGPRPHALAHNEMYRKLIKGYMIRHKVRPGITGLAQVHGYRGETRTVEQMEQRVKYDIEYMRTWSLELDLRILGKTLTRWWTDSKAY